MKLRLIAVLALLLLPAVGAHAASFDCAAAKSAIEIEICKDPALSQADALMARLYAQSRTSAFRSGPSNQLSVQRAWAKDRQDCLSATSKGYQSVGQCLQRRYDLRNHELAVATVMSDPPIGMEVLRTLDPETAPLYQAIRAYVRTPADKPALASLLAPYFAKLAAEEYRSFGRSILADEKIVAPKDMLASDHQFATGLKVISAYLEGNGGPMVLPCEAVLARPGLLEAVQPIFGSTLDNFIPRTDCAAALPPLPKFEALVTQIYKGWPACEGTIQYMAYRTFDARVEAARLADGSGKLRAKPAPRLKGVAPDAVPAATAELAKFYQTYRFLAPAKAQAAAFGSVQSVLAAGHACD